MCFEPGSFHAGGSITLTTAPWKGEIYISVLLFVSVSIKRNTLMDSTRVNSGSPHTGVFDFSHNGGAEK